VLSRRERSNGDEPTAIFQLSHSRDLIDLDVELSIELLAAHPGYMIATASASKK